MVNDSKKECINGREIQMIKKKRKGAVGCAENGEENTFRQKKTKAAAGGELQMEKAEDAANLPFPPPLHFLSTYLN